MKKRAFSLFLTFVICLSAIGIISVFADATTYKEVWAENVTLGALKKGISDSNSNIRKLAVNSLGAPDSMGNTNNVTSLSYYEWAQYEFEAKIANNPDGYDLSLYEVTKGAWHPEAVSIYLVNAVVDGVFYNEYYLGDAFNNVGNMLLSEGLIASDNGVNGFHQECQILGDLTVTHIWFPKYVEKADAVKLVDVTQKYNMDGKGNPIEYRNSLGRSSFVVNGVWYKYGTYTSQKDGFDLDAIGAWTEYIKEKRFIIEEVWSESTAVGDLKKGVSDSNSNIRKMIANSLGEPDSILNTNNVTSLAYYTWISYKFEDKTINNPNGYDISLYEVTVGAWHPEAVSIYLLNAVVDGSTYDKYYIGDAFNNVGNMLKNEGYINDNGIPGFYQECDISGDYSVTRIWFPDNIESVEGVMLVDVTEKYNLDDKGNPIEYKNALGRSSFVVNGVKYKFGTYTTKKDGFDLDAISSWVLKEIN